MNSVLHGDAKAVDNSLRALWERARRAAEVITQLREEKRHLLARVEQLEGELRHVQEELAERNEAFGKLTPESAEHEAHPGAGFSNGEREQLAGRVRDLLAKLDAYL